MAKFYSFKNAQKQFDNVIPFKKHLEALEQHQAIQQERILLEQETLLLKQRLQDENLFLKHRQQQRRDWLWGKVEKNADQKFALRRLERLTRQWAKLGTTPTHYDQLSTLQEKLFEQYALPKEYIKAQQLTEHIQSINSLLIPVLLDLGTSMSYSAVREHLQELQELKWTLYLELKKTERALLHQYAWWKPVSHFLKRIRRKPAVILQ